MALLLISLLSLFASPATTNPLYHICGTTEGYFNSNDTYNSNLRYLISILSFNASDTGFGTASTGSVPDRVFGLAMCRGDTDTTTCRSCISVAFSDMQQLCLNNKEATTWYDYCQLRYSNQDFLYAPDVTMNNQVLLYNSTSVSDDQLLRFEILTTELMGNISDLALRYPSQLVATGEIALMTTNIIYGMVQCTRDLSVSDCRTCLQGTVNEITEDPLKGMKGGMVLGFWCSMRFEFYKFYNGKSMLQIISDQPPSSPALANATTPNATNPLDLSHRGITF